MSAIQKLQRGEHANEKDNSRILCTGKSVMSPLPNGIELTEISWITKPADTFPLRHWLMQWQR